MHLLRLADVPVHPDHRVYRYSRGRALLGMSCALLAAAGAGVFAWREDAVPLYWIAAAILLITALLRRFVLARFRASSWLVRLSREGLFVQLRSYLNSHLPAEDLTVAFIPFGEVRSIRVVRERRKIASSFSPGHRGNVTEQRRQLVELELAGDASALARGLSEERARKGPRESRWYGSSSVLYRHHPARMAAPDRLELEWNVSPGARCLRDALLELAPHVQEANAEQRIRSYLDHDVAKLDHDEQEQRLRELVESGDTLAAIRLVRTLEGCDLAEAKRRVERLRS